MNSAVDTPAVTGPHLLRAYAKLAKLSFFDYYLSVAVAWTALPAHLLWAGATWTTLVLFVLGEVGVVAATVSFDDVTGLRDGSDLRNYSPASGELRDQGRKPLLAGGLTEVQAIRFGWAAFGWGLALWAAAVAVAPHRPLWAIVLIALVAVSSVQYSYGLRLSYRGGQEALLLSSTGLVVVLPFALLTGRTTGLILLEAFLFGLWSLLVSVYSNINDLEGDRAAGRRNLATLTSPGMYRGIVVGLSCAEAGAVLLAVGTGAVPVWFPLLLLPVFVARALQVRAGVLRGSPLVARVQGVKIHRGGVLLLLVGNLAVVHL